MASADVRVDYEEVYVTGRDYPLHKYRITRWGKRKIDLYIYHKTNATTAPYKTLKMTTEEAEELIVRLQFAVMEARNGA